MLPQWPLHDVGSSAAVAFWHRPPAQVEPAAQVPHEPPQPSSPQAFEAAHCFTHSQVPLALHVAGAVQVPHVPPQPSGPQVLPLHWGSHFGAQLASGAAGAEIGVAVQA